MSNRMIAATLTLFAACAAEPDAGPAPSVTMVGDTAVLELPVGRSADNGDLTISFDTVTEDSRCPIDVQCVWEGNAGIRLTLTAGDDTQVFIVNSALEPRVVSYNGYSIAFRDLRPYPMADQPRDPEAYVAQIGVFDGG